MRERGTLREASELLLLVAMIALGYLGCRACGSAPVQSTQQASTGASGPTRHPPLAAPPEPPKRLASLDLAAVDRVLQSLPTGNIAFNAPTSMILGNTYGIHLLLSARHSVQQLQAELRQRIAGQDALQGAQISIAPEMEARLTGQSFAIAAVNPERQLVSDQQETDWQWDVTPNREGTQELHLTVSVILNVENGSLPRAIQTLDRQISVQVTWGQRLSGFLGTNWQWLWAVVVAPLAAWAWQRLKKRPAKRSN